MVNTIEILRRYKEDKNTFIKTLDKYNNEELYEIMLGIRSYYEKEVIKKIDKNKILVKIQEYLYYISIYIDKNKKKEAHL